MKRLELCFLHGRCVCSCIVTSVIAVRVISFCAHKCVVNGAIYAVK